MTQHRPANSAVRCPRLPLRWWLLACTFPGCPGCCGSGIFDGLPRSGLARPWRVPCWNSAAPLRWLRAHKRRRSAWRRASEKNWLQSWWKMPEASCSEWLQTNERTQRPLSDSTDDGCREKHRRGQTHSGEYGSNCPVALILIGPAAILYVANGASALDGPVPAAAVWRAQPGTDHAAPPDHLRDNACTHAATACLRRTSSSARLHLLRSARHGVVCRWPALVPKPRFSERWLLSCLHPPHPPPLPH